MLTYLKARTVLALVPAHCQVVDFISLLPEFGEGAAADSGGEIRLVFNWFEELKRLVPAD